MTRYIEGDDSVYDSLYRILVPHVRQQIRAVFGDDFLVDDLVQETFLKVHAARLGFDISHGSKGVITWYRIIARNTAITELRRRTRGTELEARWMPGASELLPSDLLDAERWALALEHRARMRELVRESLARLPRSQRVVIELHKLYELPMREVAERLGIRLGTARVRAHRGYRAMVRRLGARDVFGSTSPLERPRPLPRGPEGSRSVPTGVGSSRPHLGG